MQSCSVAFLQVPGFCFPFHTPFPPAPSQAPRKVSKSILIRAEWQVTLLYMCNLGSRLAAIECFAFSVETNFIANCSGYCWGHLGVCIVCGNCFISAGKKNTYYHVFAADSGFCVKSPSHQRKREYVEGTQASYFQDLSLLSAMPSLSTSWRLCLPRGGVPKGFCVFHPC